MYLLTNRCNRVEMILKAVSQQSLQELLHLNLRHKFKVSILLDQGKIADLWQ